MGKRVMWKVCRIRDIHAARMCADIGADFLGLHAIERTDATRAALYRRIAIEMASYYPSVQPILVTRMSRLDDLLAAIIETGVAGVQVHTAVDSDHFAHLATQLRKLLRRELCMIAVISVEDDTGPSEAAAIARLGDTVSYLLVDTRWRGGTGEVGPAHRLRSVRAAAGDTPLIVAGGLADENVRSIIEIADPVGVDVQSRLEVSWGDKSKDPEKLFSFSRQIREADAWQGWRYAKRRMIAVSLTDVNPENLAESVKVFAETDADLFHLDHSDGSLTPQFVREPYRAAASLREVAPCMPYDVHTFIRDNRKFEAAAKKYLKTNPLLRVLISHTEDASDESINRLHQQAAIAHRLGVPPGVAINSGSFSEVSLDRVITAVRALGILSLTLVTHSSRHAISKTSQHDLRLLDMLRASFRYGDGVSIGVDRDLNLERLEILAQAKPQLAVVGRFLTEVAFPQERISRLRGLLSPQPDRTSDLVLSAL